MASSEALIDWTLSNVDRLNLRATRHTWVDSWCGGLFDFGVEINLSGRVYEGRGLATSESTAFAKAIAEALERATFAQTRFPSTNGIALHASFTEAASNAVAELIERDSFLCHFLTSTPFLEIPDDYLRRLEIGMTSWANLTSLLSKCGIHLTLAQMASPAGYNGRICVALGKDSSPSFGSVIGLGCSEDEYSASVHAVLECLKNVAAISLGEYHSGHHLSALDFRLLPRSGPLEHELYAMSSDGAAAILRLLDLQKPLVGVPQTPPSSIEAISLPLPKEVSDAPAMVVKCTSPALQDLFFGEATPEKINLERLSSFCGRHVMFSDINSSPHLLG